jgi:hypothetical protein
MIRSILIGGCGSSGTTLIAHLLNASGSVFCGPELNLFNKLKLYVQPFQYTYREFLALLENGIPTTGNSETDLLSESTHRRPDSTRNFMLNLDAYNYTKDQVSKIASECQDFDEFSDKFFGHCLKNEKKMMWAEKTPTNAYCVNEFLSLFSLGHYIHIVRDGRDVVPSLMKRGYKAEAAIRRWLHDTAAGYPFREHEKCLIIKYEDLVTHPSKIMNKIFQFLKIRENAGLLIEKAENSSIIYHSPGEWNLRPDQKISNSAMLKWKRGDYSNKVFLEQLFKHTHLDEKLATNWGIPLPCNGNVLLSLFGYDPSDDWNVNPKYGVRFLWHYFQESIISLLRPRKLYCTTSLY